VRGQMWYIRSVQLGRKINITGHRGGIKETKKRETQRAGDAARILTVRPLSRNRIFSALTALIRIKLGIEVRKAPANSSRALFCKNCCRPHDQSRVSCSILDLRIRSAMSSRIRRQDIACIRASWTSMIESIAILINLGADVNHRNGNV